MLAFKKEKLNKTTHKKPELLAVKFVQLLRLFNLKVI